jgi:hypothetical protein
VASSATGARSPPTSRTVAASTGKVTSWMSSGGARSSAAQKASLRSTGTASTAPPPIGSAGSSDSGNSSRVDRTRPATRSSSGTGGSAGLHDDIASTTEDAVLPRSGPCPDTTRPGLRQRSEVDRALRAREDRRRSAHGAGTMLRERTSDPSAALSCRRHRRIEHVDQAQLSPTPSARATMARPATTMPTLAAALPRASTAIGSRPRTRVSNDAMPVSATAAPSATAAMTRASVQVAAARSGTGARSPRSPPGSASAAGSPIRPTPAWR